MNKTEKYAQAITTIKAVIDPSAGWVANLANCAAVLHETMGFFWTGWYMVKGDELLLGPFQGPLACVRIPFGKGVCGTAWSERRTIVVPDVEEFPGHIACSSLSRSEIVVPVYSASGEIAAVLDIDSRELANFDETDARYLEKIAELVKDLL
ncbi:MAG: GAF domain-containing protein [Bacteroidales bacterium]|nr:GAF domain-containing protein [Bacteroidales bacterium]